jgi:hypothetical protein
MIYFFLLYQPQYEAVQQPYYVVKTKWSPWWRSRNNKSHIFFSALSVLYPNTHQSALREKKKKVVVVSDFEKTRERERE